MAKCMRWLGRPALLLAAFAGLAEPALASNPAAPPAPAVAPARSAPRPAIWVIEDEDTKIYLFGTVHIFPASLEWRSAALNRVIAEADELVMETPDVSTDSASAGQMAVSQMQLGKSVPILERVSPQARPALRAAIEATGMPMNYFDGLTTWGVAFLLTGFQIMGDGGAEGEGGMSGAEEVLGRLFQKRKRPVLGVETMAEQIQLFASMPVGTQREFLESTVMGVDASSAAAPDDRADESWASGDVDAIAREMQEMPDDLYDRLLTRRNRNWTSWLVKRMERPGTVLFAVGAGHLAGRDSVQRLLAERGISARRID